MRSPKGKGLSRNCERANKIDSKQMTFQKGKGLNKTTKLCYKTFQKKLRPPNARGYAKQAHGNLINETSKMKRPTRLSHTIHHRPSPA
jgi:hypothetical protein